MEEKLSGIKLHVAWNQDSTLTSTWTHDQRTLTNGLNSTSLLDYKFNLTYQFIAVDVRKGGTLLVAQLVEALCYKSEGRGSDSRWCRWNFSLT